MAQCKTSDVVNILVCSLYGNHKQWYLATPRVCLGMHNRESRFHSSCQGIIVLQPWPIFAHDITPKEVCIFGQKVLFRQVMRISIDFTVKHIQSSLCYTMATSKDLKTSFIKIFLFLECVACSSPCCITTTIIFLKFKFKK